MLAPDVPQAGDDTEAAAAPDSAAVAAALSKVGALPTPECVRHWLLEFLRHASAVVLHFKTEDAVRDLPVGAMFTVLEEVRVARTRTRSPPRRRSLPLVRAHRLWRPRRC